MRKILLATSLILLNITMLSAQKYYMLVGTYTATSDSKGIYVYSLDGKTGATKEIGIVPAENPEYFAQADNGTRIYVTNENITEETKGKGKISAYSFDKKSGQLQFLNEVPSLGDSPCFLSVDATGKNVFSANYMGGSIVAYKTEGDGALAAEKAQFIQYSGKGPHPNQEAAHLHSTFISPDQQYLYACNLGTDQIFKYSLHPNAAEPLVAEEPAFIQVPAGYGPRHLAFSPNKKFVYAICELAGKVVAFHYNNGNLESFQTINSSSKDETVDKGSAAIRVSPDGNFLYVSNRGTVNNIAIFSIAEDGKLTLIQEEAVAVHPRDFIITPNGKFLLLTARDSNSVDIYEINKKSGLIQKTANSLKISKPVAITIVAK